jgi:hypothetical protein
MAKRKKAVQKRAKRRRGNSTKRGKARKVSKAAKRTVVRAKPKREESRAETAGRSSNRNRSC